ncbi:MAG: transglutaminase domain-containing protein [Clostridia bacterium]|nr:transglutaminase domain-containing protein [Clostridia bacterium]
MSDRSLESLSCPLPKDIAALKGAGEFDLALQLIERRLREPLPAMLKTRLETERFLLPKLAGSYTLSHEELLNEMQRRVPDFTAEELNTFLLNGKLDFIYVNGQRRYFNRMPGSLVKSHPELKKRAVHDGSVHADLDAIIRRMKREDIVFRYRLRADITIDGSEPGAVYKIHMPLASRSMQQEPAADIACSVPFRADAEDAPQRTAYMETAEKKICLEYTVAQRPKYVSPLDAAVHRIVYPAARPVCEEDLIEQPPHLSFTPYLKALAKELRGAETDPVQTAWRFYDYITSRVIYSFMPPYRLMESGAEYTAVNRRGDCGMLALLFIALCRISGIPARWQSGLDAAPGDVGHHDWAEFFSDRLGWLPVDCSYGGSAFRAGNEERRCFYFGNLDPYRMVANRIYFAAFTPEKKFPRFDPYDSQGGEIETDAHGLLGDEFDTDYTMLWHEITSAD